MPDGSDETHDIRRKRRIDRAIAALADNQHGVVAIRQLEVLGLSRRAVEHRAATGRLHRVERGAYAVGRASLTREGHWMAAVLTFGEGAVLSHRTAAALWGLRQSAWKIDITVPKWRRSRTGIWLHCSVLPDEEVTAEDGIPVTTVARTLLDLATVLDRHQLVKTVEEAERRGLFDLRAADAVLERSGRRPEARALRSVLAEYRDPGDTRSKLERDFAGLIRRSRLPAPQVNVIVEGFLVDCFWPHPRLVVELDSRSYHTSPRAFETDRLRDTQLIKAGYRVVRITRRRLQDDPAGVLHDVRQLLASPPAARPLPARRRETA